MIGRAAAHFRSRLGSGLLILLPLIFTVWLLKFLFDAVHESVSPAVTRLLRWVGVEGLDQWPRIAAIPLIEIAVVAILVYVAGVMAGNLVGRRVLALVEAGILRVPLVKGIYGAARQLLDAFGGGGARPFSRVVLLEFPRPGVHTVGFVTRESEHRLSSGAGEGSVSVFVPTAPNPTSGWVLLVRKRDLIDLDLSVEQGLKWIVSGGIVGPADLGVRLRRGP